VEEATTTKIMVPDMTTKLPTAPPALAAETTTHKITTPPAVVTSAKPKEPSPPERIEPPMGKSLAGAQLTPEQCNSSKSVIANAKKGEALYKH